MKSGFLVVLVFLTFSSLSAEEPTLQGKIEIAKKEWEDYNWEVYVSPGVIPDLGIGCINRKNLKRSYHEGTYLIHADLIPSVWELRQNFEDFYKIYIWGIKYRSSYFYKPDYSGFNWFFNVGFNSLLIDLPLDPGGSSGSHDPRWYIFPDLAIGCGYSWKLKNNHFFRISLDAGVKLIISNLYFSYVW
jgi:hypothetical protein